MQQGISTRQKEGQIFYSLCTQQYENLPFYSRLLQKLHVFAKSFDEGTPAARENVWNRLYSLMGLNPIPSLKEGPLFTPLFTNWLKEPTINLFGLELLHVAFMTSTCVNADSNLDGSSAYSSFASSQANSTMNPFNYTIPSALFQLSLLQHWESKLEKLSVIHKKAIWNLCTPIPIFSNYDKTSFRKTFEKWASNPLLNITYITIFFGAIGYLKEIGILKGEFCYPKTKNSVFPNKNYVQMHHNFSTPVSPPSDSSSSDISSPSSSSPSQYSPPISFPPAVVVHPYRRNSSVDLQTLVAKALTNLSSPEQIEDPAQVIIKVSDNSPQSQRKSSLSSSTRMPRRRESKVEFNEPENLVEKKRRRSSGCSGEEILNGKRRKSIMNIKALLC